MLQKTDSASSQYLRILASSAGRAAVGGLAIGLVGIFLAGPQGGIIGAILGGVSAAIWR